MTRLLTRALGEPLVAPCHGKVWTVKFSQSTFKLRCTGCSALKQCSNPENPDIKAPRPITFPIKVKLAVVEERTRKKASELKREKC